jgi:hypothetical protein
VLRKVLLEGYSLYHLSKRRPSLSLPTLRYRFRQTLQRFIAQPDARQLPAGPLILLADGLWFQFDKKPWVLYLIALKPCKGKKALFLDPILLPGKEAAIRWKQAFANVPPEAYRRIRALAVDNLRGMDVIARRERWVLQLCQFHLILKLQAHRGMMPHRLQGGKVRQEIFLLVRQALDAPDTAQTNHALARLADLISRPCGPQRIEQVVREFLRRVAYYRSCRMHPSLGLPATTNAVESMGGVIRDMLRRNRSASSPKALLAWATALIRLRPEVVCNGKHHQPK